MSAFKLPERFGNARADSSTACFIASRAIRKVFRMFGSSSTIKIRMDMSQGMFE